MQGAVLSACAAGAVFCLWRPRRKRRLGLDDDAETPITDMLSDLAGGIPCALGQCVCERQSIDHDMAASNKVVLSRLLTVLCLPVTAPLLLAYALVVGVGTAAALVANESAVQAANLQVVGVDY